MKYNIIVILLATRQTEELPKNGSKLWARGVRLMKPSIEYIELY